MNKYTKISTLLFMLVTIITILPIVFTDFPHIDSKQAIMQYYQKNSLKPILHVYYNRHFSQSKQFQNFVNVLNEFQEQTRDYIYIAFTDCEQDKQSQLRSCQQMKRTKDNRLIMATYPSSQFIKMGALQIQSPPLSRLLDHQSDSYEVDNLKNLMNTVMPNFYKQIHNLEEYQDFLRAKYVPKLILFLRQDEQQDLPLVLKQLAVTFALRFDFGIVYDLNDEIMPIYQQKINKFPKFLVMKYNFQQQKYETQIYKQSILNEDNYERIKQFLQRYALNQPRNDKLFHKIAVQTKTQIKTVQKAYQLQQIKQKSSGWLITARTNSHHDVPETLYAYQKKYGAFYNYAHFRDQNYYEDQEKITLFNPLQNKQYQMVQDGGVLQYNTLTKEQFVTNMTVWLRKDFVVIGVVQQYGYTCSITEKTLFRGHTRCLIIKQDDIEDLKQMLKLQFQTGFIVRTQPEKLKDGDDWFSQQKHSQPINSMKKATRGIKLSAMDYLTVYQQLQFATRMKLKQILDAYTEQPITQPKTQVSLFEACFHPTKKCLILLTDLSKKDRTAQDYIKQIAINYVDGYQFIELDISSNPELVKQIGMTKDRKSQLMVFYPRTQQYVKLNKKITKGLIQKFLRANQINDKRLKRNQFQKQTNSIHIRPRAHSSMSKNEQL